MIFCATLLTKYLCYIECLAYSSLLVSVGLNWGGEVLCSLFLFLFWYNSGGRDLSGGEFYGYFPLICSSSWESILIFFFLWSFLLLFSNYLKFQYVFLLYSSNFLLICYWIFSFIYFCPSELFHFYCIFSIFLLPFLSYILFSFIDEMVRYLFSNPFYFLND